ncbi:TIGR04222 domain-containing membrane protein [Nonomuraea pusilla]|uniref:TIGR04222 domain-containing protein n=1 Tax=Nonomuraea pusilla TaxID=46177 RepID=A0A1H7GNQ2_9ACTN|nr:TIGR04222 domain-containing membrane protein [Nonomuraea pusilla]SEK39699.1 TIGR04222 domain-containing protein [Nonomuraea pusilla]
MDSVLLLTSGALAALTILNVMAMVRERAAIRAAAAGARPRGLGACEVAYLAGGPRRVAVTALAASAMSGTLRMSRGGGVQAVAGAPQAIDPVERELLGRVTPGSVHHAGALRREVARGEAVYAIRTRLTGLGLLVPERRTGTWHRRLAWLRVLSTLALIVGAFQLFMTLGDGGWTRLPGLVLAAATFVGGWVAARVGGSWLPGALTREGLEELETMRRLVPPGSAGAAPALAVALHGLSEIRDADLRHALDAGAVAGSRGRRSSCAAGSCGGGGGSWGCGGGHSGGGHSGGGCGSGASCGGGSGCGSGCGGGCGGGGD